MGLTQSTALIVGSIVGVGIFSLPYSLAGYGSISLVAMLIASVGAMAFALLFAALTRRIPGRRRPLRLRAIGLRQPHRLRQRLVVLDHRLGRQRGDRRRLGLLRRDVREQGRQHGSDSILIALAGLWIPAAVNLSGLRNVGVVPGRDDAC